MKTKVKNWLFKEKLKKKEKPKNEVEELPSVKLDKKTRCCKEEPLVQIEYEDDILDDFEEGIAALEEDDTAENGITFKSFEIVSVLGHGSYGTVYKAFLKTDKTKTPLAMKA